LNESNRFTIWKVKCAFTSLWIHNNQLIYYIMLIYNALLILSLRGYKNIRLQDYYIHMTRTSLSMLILFIERNIHYIYREKCFDQN